MIYEMNSQVKNMSRYTYTTDDMNDCITLYDDEEELKTSFDSEIVLYPLEDSVTVVDKLNFYEALVKELKMHLEYHDWADKDFKDVIEEVELNLE